MNNNLKKAKLIIYLQSLLQFQGFIGPVIFIFYTKYMGLNTSQYLFCDSLLFLIMSVCEVPSGLISDYVGRKKMLIISQLFICLGMMILLFVPSYTGAVIVSIIYGIFGALQSGNSESILYEIYEKHNNIKYYENIQSKSRSVGFIFSIVYAVISGYVIEYNLALPVILDLIVCIILLIFTIILLDDSNYSKKEIIILANKKDIHNVIYIILVVSILFSCSRVMFSFYQPTLNAAKFPVVFMGYASAIYSLITAGSAFFYKRMRELMTTRKMYILIISFQLLTGIGMVFVKNYFVIIFIFIQQFQRGLMGTFLYMQVNRYINSKNRNRVSLMSIMYCIISIFTGISLYVTSIITKNIGFQNAILCYVIFINLLLVLSIVLFVQKDRQNKLIRYDIGG